MVAFIVVHRKLYGIELTSKDVLIAPSTYYEYKGREAGPSRLPARAQRDHGSLHLLIRYTEGMSEACIEPSFASTGNSYDNALAETVIGLYKTEITRRHDVFEIPSV